MSIKIPPPYICDINCFYPPNHAGPHQFELETCIFTNCFYDKGHHGPHEFEEGTKVAVSKKDPIREALEKLAEAASSLATHGASGYNTDSSALDVVFLRALINVHNEIGCNDNCDFYDPFGLVYENLPSEE